MIFVTGPLYSGKKDYIKKRMGWDEEQLEDRAIWDVQQCVEMFENIEQMEHLADFLTGYDVVIATEVGGGVVPVDADERRNREMAGRLSCLLAERADEVVRVFCGIPTILKTGEK